MSAGGGGWCRLAKLNLALTLTNVPLPPPLPPILFLRLVSDPSLKHVTEAFQKCRHARFMFPKTARNKEELAHS